MFYDINLSQQEAQNWATYLEEGLYVDSLTQEITVEVLTYNAPLRIVGYLLLGFSFNEGGTITVRVHTHEHKSVTASMRAVGIACITVGAQACLWVQCVARSEIDWASPLLRVAPEDCIPWALALKQVAWGYVRRNADYSLSCMIVQSGIFTTQVR